MSVGPEALQRFGPLLFLACPRGQAAVRARGAGLLCAPHGCSGCRRARPPARLGVLTAFGAASRGPPWPSGPSGTLHTSRAVVADVARRIVSKPSQAPPPPTSTTARPTNSSGTLHTGGVCPFCAYPIQAPPPPTSTTADPPIPAAPSTPVGLWWLTLLSASPRSPARPRRRPRAPQPGPPIPPAPSTPVWFVVTVRIPSRPRRRPPAPQPGPPIPPAPSTPVAVGFYRIRSRLPTCRGSNDATFPFGGGEATT